MKKMMITAVVASMAMMSVQAQSSSAPKDTVKASGVNVKTDTVKVQKKPKETGAVYSTGMTLALGTFDEPQTDTAKTKVKADTIKTGSLNNVRGTYAMIFVSPQTDSIKTKSDTVKTIVKPKKTGSIHTIEGTIVAYNRVMNPQTDTVKTKPKADTIKTETKPKTTGSIEHIESGMYARLLLSEVEDKI